MLPLHVEVSSSSSSSPSPSASSRSSASSSAPPPTPVALFPDSAGPNISTALASLFPAPDFTSRANTLCFREARCGLHLQVLQEYGNAKEDLDKAGELHALQGAEIYGACEALHLDPKHAASWRNRGAVRPRT